MSETLAGKVVLVTGGANGLGRMIAEGLMAAGAEVLITSRRQADDAAREMQRDGRCFGINVDLAAEGAVDELAAAVRARTERLHAIINNAGKTWGAQIDGFPDSAWAGVLDINLRVPFAVVQRLLPQLEVAATSDDPARIVNIGSVAGIVVEPLNAFSYAASKAGLHHLSRELAATLAPRNITVNTIIPGYFPTRMTAHMRKDEQASDEVKRRIPLGRFGRPQDISGLAVFLLSRSASYITGAEIPVDGGLCGCR
jgi:NAD(P)-dependent dehydrogenase (short-subunit alcohol dehydrogenase family)